ncbi:hypothetical protein ABMA46_18645 [Mesorhizobium sp. CN5-321]|jgi:hypothetical protein|uniref:hypothetical protein n=1 Tax=Mesorhizobium hunchu TaxID=3157708 RepID=UPI0032B72B2E
MGNQMLQYMWALNLQRLTDDTHICGHDIPFWGIKADVPDEFGRHPLRLGGHFLNVDHVGKLIRNGTVKNILLGGLGFQIQNYASPEFYRKVFLSDAIEAEGYGEEYVVFNIRGAEILKNCHADYRPVPFSYFDTVIATAKARPVFLGQIGDDDYSRELRKRYPDAVFQPSRGPLIDFETLRRSHQIAIAVSTFSWLAGWLSSAKVIHYPMSGMLNPLQRPDIDLTPSEDPRYRFYHFPVQKWSATAAEMNELWVPGEHRLLSVNEVCALRQRAAETIRWQRRWKRLKISSHAQLLRLLPG